MPKYNVFYYLQFHTKVEDIEANSMEEAIAKGLDDAWERGHSCSNDLIEFAEGQSGALVDVVGDTEYTQSAHFTEAEVFKAEGEHNGT